MSLVPIGVGNPVVAKISNLLTSASRTLDVPGVFAGAGPARSETAVMQSRMQAGAAVQLLERGGIHPERNAMDALDNARAGVAKLDRLIGPATMRPDFAAQTAVDAQVDFNNAVTALNRHHF